MQVTRHKGGSGGEQGFMLLGLIVAIFLILLALSVAAPQIGRSLRRDRDLEAVHRGNQYVRGIREYYVKFQRYPGSLEQLEKTNNIRYLRQRYKDPIDGKDDFRLIPVGQNKTTVKGFFGQPLAGLATTGLGSATGIASPGIGQTPGPSTGAGGSSGATGGTGPDGATGSTGSSLPGLFGVGSSASGSSMFGGGSVGPFMGVGLSVAGDSIVEVNQQTTYATWEFLYDPRIELLKAAGAAGASVGSTAAGSLGQTPVGSPTGATPFGGSTAPGATPFGGSPAPAPAPAPPAGTPY